MYTLVKHFTLLYQDIRANFEKHTCYCNSVGLGGPCPFLNQMYTFVKHSPCFIRTILLLHILHTAQCCCYHCLLPTISVESKDDSVCIVVHQLHIECTMNRHTK